MRRHRWTTWRQARGASARKASTGLEGSADQATLRLDPRRRAALRGNQRIELTAREFRLLDALVQREGETCSKHDLAQLVWGSSIPGGPQLIDEYVRRLHGKLGEVIETVGDAGYRYPATR